MNESKQTAREVENRAGWQTISGFSIAQTKVCYVDGMLLADTLPSRTFRKLPHLGSCQELSLSTPFQDA